MTRLGLLVTDASPLITLAAADALDCLTMPGAPVIIPDMVYFDVTQDLARTGAAGVVEWSRRHPGQVEIAPTTTLRSSERFRRPIPHELNGQGE